MRIDTDTLRTFYMPDMFTVVVQTRTKDYIDDGWLIPKILKKKKAIFDKILPKYEIKKIKMNQQKDLEYKISKYIKSKDYKGVIPPYIVLTQPQGRFSEEGFFKVQH